MTLLQPLEVPSREGINNAITSEIAEALSTSDPASPFYDSGWVPLPGPPAAPLSLTTVEYRVKSGMVQVRFAGTLTAGLSIPISGNMSDVSVGVLPADARPGGGGIAASAPFPVEVGGSIIHALVYNGGSVNLAYGDRTGAAYTLGSNGTSVVCISPLWTINS